MSPDPEADEIPLVKRLGRRAIVSLNESLAWSRSVFTNAELSGGYTRRQIRWQRELQRTKNSRGPGTESGSWMC